MVGTYMSCTGMSESRTGSVTAICSGSSGMTDECASIEPDRGRLHQLNIDTDLALDQRIEPGRRQRHRVDSLRREFLLHGRFAQCLLRLGVEPFDDLAGRFGR